MENKELKAKLDEVVNKIKTNSKDAHFASSLLDDLLSLKGQMDVKPIDFNLGDRVDDFKGEFFEIVRTTEGAIFRTYGGLLFFVRPNLKSLYDSLVSFIDGKDEYDTMTDEEKERHDLVLTVVSYILTLPMYAFSDADFATKIATEVVAYLNKKYEEAMGEPLQEETPVENAEYEEAEKNLDEIKKELVNDEK